MRYEAQKIADALQKVISAAIIDYQASVGCDGIPVQHYGFITDASWDEEGDELEVTIAYGGGERTWVIRPQEVAPIPPTASVGRHRAELDGGLFWSHPKG